VAAGALTGAAGLGASLPQAASATATAAASSSDLFIV
jgi:hypothetical protein